MYDNEYDSEAADFGRVVSRRSSRSRRPPPPKGVCRIRKCFQLMLCLIGNNVECGLIFHNDGYEQQRQLRINFCN
jgi:hypothetical protein